MDRAAPTAGQIATYPGAAMVLTRLDGLNWAYNGILPGSGYVAGDPYGTSTSTSSSSARTSRA